MIINHVDYNNHIKVHFRGIRIQEVAFLGKDTKKQTREKLPVPRPNTPNPKQDCMQ